MKVLIAGGIYRLDAEERRRRQASPEMNLEQGLRDLGVEVSTSPLEDLRRLASASRYDVVHVHHLSRGALVAALSPVVSPMVFTVHAGVPPSDRAQRLALRAVLRRMSAGVCLSAAEARVWSALEPRCAGRLTVIPNGIPALGIAPRPRTWDRHRRLRMLYVGQLIDLKRVDHALRAVARLPDTELELVYHNADLEAELCHLAESLDVTDRVTFSGQLGRDELAARYAESDVLVLPSRTEALPSVVTEALLTGLPVVASDVGGVRGQVGRSGVVFPVREDEGDSLVEALGTLMSTFDDVATAASTGSADLSARYSVAAMAQSHLDLYTSLTQRKR